MLYTRIKSYSNGKFTGCEQLYSTINQSIALQKFRADYPGHKECLLIAETYDSEKNKEHFEICKSCGCVNNILI